MPELLLKKINVYKNRDLVYKIQYNNVHFQSFSNLITIIGNTKKIGENLLPYISSFILLFDKMPMILQIKKSTDNKVINTLKGVKLTLNNLLSWQFFTKIRNNFEQHSLFNNTFSKNTNKQNLHITPLAFDEISFFYEHFLLLQDFLINFNDVIQLNKEQRNLYFSTL